VRSPLPMPIGAPRRDSAGAASRPRDRDGDLRPWRAWAT
jgi:hypothetical protein